VWNGTPNAYPSHPFGPLYIYGPRGQMTHFKSANFQDDFGSQLAIFSLLPLFSTKALRGLHPKSTIFVKDDEPEGACVLNPPFGGLGNMAHKWES